MTIELDHIIPIPLKDRFKDRPSDIWNHFLQIDSTEFIKVKAPSGTGKTTLIHILYKLRNDYEGNVLINSNPLRDIKEDKLADLRQSGISVVFQDLRLFPNLTARENIELNRVLQKPFYGPEKIDMMAEELGISHILEQSARLCSYGEQQRVAIIRALMQPFEWLIMDEPFSHLDHANTRIAASLITKECSNRKAGFLITDLDEDSHFDYSRKLIL